MERFTVGKPEAVGMLTLEQQREYLELKKRLVLHAKRQREEAIAERGNSTCINIQNNYCGHVYVYTSTTMWFCAHTPSLEQCTHVYTIYMYTCIHNIHVHMYTQCTCTHLEHCFDTGKGKMPLNSTQPKKIKIAKVSGKTGSEQAKPVEKQQNLPAAQEKDGGLKENETVAEETAAMQRETVEREAAEWKKQIEEERKKKRDELEHRQREEKLEHGRRKEEERKRREEVERRKREESKRRERQRRKQEMKVAELEGKIRSCRYTCII